MRRNPIGQSERIPCPSCHRAGVEVNVALFRTAHENLMKPRYDPDSGNLEPGLTPSRTCPFVFSPRLFPFCEHLANSLLRLAVTNRLLNLVTMNRPKAAVHIEGSWHPPTGMWKNSRKLRFPKRAIRVVSRQFPCPGGSLEISKSNWRTGFLARLLFTCSLKIRRSGTRSSPMGLTIKIFPEGRI